MTQESTNPDPQPAADEPSVASTSPEAAAEEPETTPVAVEEPPPPEPPATTEPPPKPRGKPWLLLLAAAIIPAVIVGAAVFFLFGGSDEAGDDSAAGIVDGLIRLGPTEASTTTSYKGELPPEFATDFPMYENADIVVSIAIASDQGTSYFIVLSTDDPSSEVFDYYSTALDAEPWQVEIGRSSSDFTGLRFLRPDNIDVSGDITLHQSTLDDRTTIYLSYDDISQAVTPGADADPFTLGNTRPLPPGFPDDVPIYAGGDPSVVLDTYFERAQGGQAFIVTFLTRDTEEQVIEFYRSEFTGRGWNVSDAGVTTTSFALGIEFDDGDDQSLNGSITADQFQADTSFTQVDMLIQVSSTRSRGN